MNYTPTEAQIAAARRVDEERKEVCRILSEKWRVKKEKAKQESKKGKKK